MSCTTPCLIPACFASADQVECVVEIIGDRLLAIDVLAGAIALRNSSARICVVAASKNSVSSGFFSAASRSVVEARDAVRLGERRELFGVAPDQDRIGHDPVAILQSDAALVADRDDRPDQVLVHAHAAGDAVHDDAETMLRHRFFLNFSHVLVENR